MSIFSKIRGISMLLFFVPQLLGAQPSNMSFRHLNTDDGLSQSRVRCILRDSKGYMWFGTHDGLNKYNGRQVVIYRNQSENPKSISNDRISDIHEDFENNIWVATEGGLNLYVPEDGTFRLFKNNPADNSSISGDYINCIYTDNQHNVWFGTENGKEGLNKWNPESKTFTRYQIACSENSELANSVTNIVQDKKDNLWIASRDDGLFCLEPDQTKFTHYNDSSLNSLGVIKRLFIDSEGIIWVSTFGAGLFSFDPATNKFTKYNSLSDGKGTNGTLLYNIIQEDKDHLLIAVDQGGINRFNKQTKLFEYIEYDSNNPNGLNNNGIWCLYKDLESILWVGTSGGGVNIYNPKSQKFKLIKNIPGEPNSLSYDVVGSIYEDSKGLLWIATDGMGVSVYNPKTQQFKNYIKDSNDPSSIPNNVIRQVVEDKNHDYWFGTWDGGLIKLNHKTGQFTQYGPNSKTPYKLSNNTVWYNMVDHKGIIWLCIHEFGIDLLDPDIGIIKRFKLTHESNGSQILTFVNFLYEDSHLNMWVCTNRGLKQFDSITNSFKGYQGILSNDIRSFIEDEEGYYWAGTVNKGLIRFKEDGEVLKIYDVSRGLPSNLINGILEDEHNNIWISTGQGISRINYKTEKIRNYSVGDGLQGKQFFLHSHLKTSWGEMYFGGFNGLNSFFPDSLKDNDYIPPVYINEFLLFNKPVKVGDSNSPLKNLIEQTQELVLSWKQSVFSFGFIAVHYTHPEENLYAYKMEGFDKDWNYTDDSRRLATYTNLNAGEYTFRVKASNNDGVWNEKGTSIKITILPPWWQTWLFKILVGILIVGSSFSFYFYRLNKLKKQKHHLEKIVNQRTQEILEKNEELISRTEELSEINTVLIDNNRKIRKQEQELRESNARIEAVNKQLREKQDLILMQTNDLKVVNQKLREANASKDKFVSIISHDLRSPFNSFLGLTQLMASQASRLSMDKIQKLSVNMKNSATSLFRLLENLLQWSRMQQGAIPFNPELLPLNKVVNDSIAMLADVVKNKDIEMSYFVPNDLTVFADNNMLQSVIRNLVSNALKFTPKKGHITLDAKVNDDRSVEIAIKDSGIGMPPEMVRSLFSLDVQVKRNGTDGEPSSGLGLLLCKEFIEKNGGKIWAESDMDSQGHTTGSTFYFTIPMQKTGSE